MRYGGNTSCLEVRCGPHILIFDGGTGLRPLGQDMMKDGPITADMFFTHTHLDHMVGVPFFAPLYQKESNIRLWAGHLEAPRSIKDALSGMMVEPLFPVPPEVFSAKPSYHDFKAGATLNPQPGISIRTVALNHPNGATGYRVDWGGKSICYITDCEHDGKGPDRGIVDLVKGADIFIYDSTYTDDEYPKFKGWGHSTWQEGARIADAAGVKTFVIFHHDPSHIDDVMDSIAAEAAQARRGTIVAREGLVLEP